MRSPLRWASLFRAYGADGRAGLKLQKRGTMDEFASHCYQDMSALTAVGQKRLPEIPRLPKIARIELLKAGDDEQVWVCF
jgi:hypothetical protein